MANKKYQEGEVMAQLKKNPDLNVLQNTKTVQELTRDHSKGSVGIHTKGKIDFLVNYHNWTHYFVSSFK